MPLDLLTRSPEPTKRKRASLPRTQDRSLHIHPDFADCFARLGLFSTRDFLELHGEIVSGHPDRHVMRVELPGLKRALYLKRQHVVGWRERFRNRVAGFGWSSRCEREWKLLKQLNALKLAAPRWAAFGSLDGSAFLLVEECADSIELRQLLCDRSVSPPRLRAIAAMIGRAVAAIHNAGFTTPDLTAKHVLVNPDTLRITLLDWQSATRCRNVSVAKRMDALGALNASIGEELAASHYRWRVAAAYQREMQAKYVENVFLPGMVVQATAHHAKRRSIRDQLHPVDSSRQRLVWLAGEAVCAIPEIAANWPCEAIANPFYGTAASGTVRIRFAGREAILVRGRSFAPLGRIRAWLRATSWRSPGVTIGRVLFHLERYGVPAPKLFAFGQRMVGPASAEWFAMYEPPGETLRERLRRATHAERTALGRCVLDCLRELHAAGCVLEDVSATFAVAGERVMVADPRAVRIVKQVSGSARRRDERAVADYLELE